VAADYLKHQKHMRILGKRVRVGRRDEIDLVARDGECLVFVEVKTRGSERYGRPAAAVDRAKRHALSRAAVRYIRSLRHARDICFRFDVVEVIGTEQRGCQTIRHIEQAFFLESRYSLP
jgi:putative endonuclease